MNDNPNKNSPQVEAAIKQLATNAAEFTGQLKFDDKITATPKKPVWVAPIDSIPESEKPRWERHFVVLYYKAYNDEGKPLPAPTKL